jgi:hypothetical protein
MEESNWGLQKEDLALDDVFKLEGAVHRHEFGENEAIIMGENFAFPLDIAYEKIFIGGKTGSGKSYAAGVMMEEFSRHGLQFVCFDALDAHSGLKTLTNVECITPREDETVNLVKLVNNLKNSNTSLVINLVKLRLDTQQRLMGDYCETLLAEDFEGKPIMTFLEECQDFVPQMGKPYSFSPIVRLCKLGRGKGLGATLISQRPAAIHKEALSQVSTYMVHNVINTKDLEALKMQLSFGTDKETIKKILSGISYSGPGEMVCFSPKYFKDVGYIKVGKVDRPRRTEHGGKNIEVKSQLAPISPNTVQTTSELRNSSSDLLFNKTPYFEKSDFSQEEAYANEGEDDFLDDYYGEEDNNLLQWDPSYGQELDKKVLDEPNNNSNAMKAVAAVGLFSTGIYLITRGISKRN